jgi:hypothetical protein
MATHDPIGRSFHANLGSAHNSSKPAHASGSHRNESEPTSAAHLIANLADDFTSSWEAAWIDFGGEG